MDVLLTRREVERIVGLSRSTIYAMKARGDFPSPVRVGRQAVRWKKSSILRWIEQLPERLSRFHRRLIKIEGCNNEPTRYHLAH